MMDSSTSDGTSLGLEAVLTEAIVNQLKPLVVAIDDRIKCTRSSQVQLRNQIDSLAEDLRRVSELHSAPYEIEPHVKVLKECRKRLAVVCSILQNVQERLHKLHFNVEKETTRRKALLEQPAPAPPE